MKLPHESLEEWLKHECDSIDIKRFLETGHEVLYTARDAASPVGWTLIQRDEICAMWYRQTPLSQGTVSDG